MEESMSAKFGDRVLRLPARMHHAVRDFLASPGADDHFGRDLGRRVLELAIRLRVGDEVHARARSRACGLVSVASENHCGPGGTPSSTSAAVNSTLNCASMLLAGAGSER